MDNNFNPSGAQQPEENQLRLSWHVVLERRWLIISIFCVAVLASLI